MSAEVIGNTGCPRCQALGNDSSNNNRVLYSDGGHFCFACGDLKTGSGYKKTSNSPEHFELPMYTTESILSSRGINAEVIKSYGVSTVVDDSGQMLVRFPFTDVNRAIDSYQYREVDSADGSLTKNIKFSKGKIKLPIFGWSLVGAHTRTLVLCEGLTDCLYVASNYSRNDTVVLGLASAISSKRAAAHLIAYDKDYKIVLAFDNDDAGRDATDAFTGYFETHDESKVIYRLNFPQEHKDVSDWRPSAELLKEHIESAQPISLTGLLGSEEISQRVGEYFESLCSSSIIELSFSPTLSKALRLMPGKLIGVIGASGEGKSTFVEHVAMEFLQQKLNVFAVSQEMLAEEFAIKLLRMVRNEPLDDPFFVRRMSKEAKENVVRQTNQLMRLLNMTDGFGQMSIESIDRHIHKLTGAGRHPDLVIVDHLLAISGDSESGTILDTCRDLKAMARGHSCCVIILSHTSKPPKGRGIQQPTLNSAFGSSGLPIYCDGVMGISSDKQACITMVETVKLERLGGAYANVTFSYADYCLSEQQEGKKSTYTEEDDSEDTEENTYY